ncbi:MAG TPA: UDP-galactopyranose mutase, partial [Ferruginibacter sp.]|nr:UDP-galactopyranose mutase [Ferruginibacter sp.]
PSTDLSGYDHIFYTGPIDAWFKFKYGRLGYRTVTFETHYADGDFQGTTQMNFCDEEVPYTRITEHKHFTNWEKHDQTIYFKEFSKETTPSDIPYYPKRLEQDKKLLLQYRTDAETLHGISFLGRLATYRYMDMHHVIGEALDFAKSWLLAVKTGQKPPVFPNREA